MLKNAKDACATEALEIATYTAIEQLARSVGDEQTAKLAASIRADEEKMLKRILREMPKLTAAVVGADVEGDPSYDVTKTGAADAARATGKAAAKTARKTGAKAKRSTRQARKVPGVAQAEGQVKGAVASQSDLAIARYDKLTAEEIVAKLPELSQIELAKVDSYERTPREPHHGPRPRQHAPRRRAVAGLRRAHRLRDPDRARRGRRRPRQGRARLRARPQGPRRRAQGHRARARQRLTRRTRNQERHMSMADSARKIPGVAAAEGVITGALATEQDLPIATALDDTDALTAREAKNYERDHKGRTGVIETAETRIDSN